METNKNFILTDEFKINEKGIKLFRIKCIKKFNDVNVDDLGGFIERYENLSDNAWVYGDVEIFGNAKVYGNARVYGNAEIHDNAAVFGNAVVSGNAWIYGNAEVYGYATICNNAWICGNAKVYGEAIVLGNARIFGDAKICNIARIAGDARIFGDAEIMNHLDYSCFQSFGRAGRTTIVFREKENKIKITCGCFSGSIKEFEKIVEETHGDSKFGREYKAIINVIKIKFDLI